MTQAITGRATAAGTSRYRQRFDGLLNADHFRRAPATSAGAAAALHLSSLGIGTYLGEPTPEDDAGYRDSVIAAVEAGCNVIDSSINYRFQRSERSIGQALAALTGSRGFARDEIVVATKGGFIPFDGDYPAGRAGAQQWVNAAIIERGLAEPADVVAGCHIMTPRYLEAQIDWSLGNLGLEAIDIYYLHNPETQLPSVPRPEFLHRVRLAFELFERKVKEGRIGIYGVATWDGFRVPPSAPGHLSLAELLDVAVKAGGQDHHFRAVQLPVNLVMSEACLLPTQSLAGRMAPLLAATQASEMTVMSSGSLLQGQIIGALSPQFAEAIPGATSNAQRGLQVVRSTPGVATALVGMKQTAHVADNMGLAKIPRLAPEAATSILRACSKRQD